MAGSPARDGRGRARPERGQATVELALVLPLCFALIILLCQVALVVRDDIRVTHAARVAVREASVTADRARVRAAATDTLAGARTRIVRRGGAGEPVEVEVSYVSPTRLPLVGVLLPDVTLRARAAMRVEQ